MRKTGTMSQCFLPALLLLASGAAQAGAAEDAAQLFLQEAARGLGNNVTVTVQAPEAALPRCTDPQAFLPGHDQRLLGRVTVAVRCGDGQTRYLQARVTAIGQYWVAAENIPVGTLVTPAMLESRSGDLTALPGQAVLDETGAVGRVATRTLTRGSVVQSSQLRAPSLIHRNRTVSVEATGAGFRVTRQGEALEDGALGDTVRVRMGNRSVLTGVVAGNDLVKVNF
ncbi:MAG TPA: flagellar basal body P-ring formation chaperone FlgA [Rhodanobacteraceae bacterium]|nr:flagellar basal body P-ring formation chaperone FlgA [Rhodanobacteraceae bacterium]